MDFLHRIEEALRAISTNVPVEIFTLAGSFIEEVIAPIPSPLVLTMAGGIAFGQQRPMLFLLWLSLIGTLGKSAGAWLVYYFSAAMENVLVKRFGKFLGVSGEDVTKISGYFRGGWRDFIILFLLRAAPIMPSSPVSVVCGLIRINFRTYMLATVTGTYVRNLLYLIVGYAGVSSYESLISGLSTAESVIQNILLVLVVLFLAWIYWKRRKGRAFHWLK